MYLNQALVPLSMSNPSNQSKKRGIGEIDSVDRQSNNEEKSDENKMENFQMRDVMQGISNIQTTLANLLLRIDGHGRQIDAVTSEISGKHGIEERLENVQHQANDTMYIINELQENQKKTERELSRMKDYVVRLEYCVKTQNDQITELKAISMEDNIIVSGVEEMRSEMSKPENLAKIISNVFSSEMNIDVETVDNLQIYKLFRMGEYDRQRKFPRPICVQFANKAQKEIIMRHIKVLKEKKSPIRVSQHQPEELREKRKRLYEIQKQYAQRNIETTLKGTKLIFTKSKSVYKDKIGSRPTAEEIINGEEVKIAITAGKTTEDNGNRFAAHAVPVDSYKQVRRSLVEVMRSDSISSASHNIFAFRFTGSDNDVKNTLVVVSRWYGNKIGPRRFKHINEVGLSAARNMSGST